MALARTQRVWNSNTCRHHVIVKALRDVRVGEELLVSYGRNYWDMDLVERSRKSNGGGGSSSSSSPSSSSSLA